ncbi:O-antigen ligase family protein [Paraflavitalea sp. CAU 1676]|uniref:O-antigen ligase family protein n=1 Tax=Paraflavitalea sp. CAU 1676 TaxID=3032598 RepID=UPI0023D98A5F|nr:O-antigen ligase family protein [Paraflavitalea sp. CAU 1676]MDF2187510.1 O-antigen ligase family protein [Paraflavitalea sp. CAU 1676]
MLYWLKYHFLEKKMTTGLGISVLGLIAISMSYLTVMVNPSASIGIVAGMAGILIFILCMLYPKVGYYATYIICLGLLLPSRLFNIQAMIPTGLIPEYLSYLTLLGVITRQEYSKEVDRRFWNSALTIWIGVLMFYYLLQIVNPSGASKLGWFNFIRKQFSFAAFFYMSYCFFNSKKSVQFFMKFWIILSTFEAIYACKQQWFGFSTWEYIWLTADPVRLELFVNGGFVRRFGLLSDPAAAGILYASSTVFVLVLALQEKNTRLRFLYYVLSIIHFLASSYTGTRTATLMIVAAIVFYCVLTLYQRRTLIFSGVFAGLLVGLLVVPIYDNMIINRLRSTFEGSKDPSALVRDVNRKIAQPYVWSHPMGGGLNTAGLIGAMYSPGHFLSFIPPDSAYMQTMMEQGPVGLALMLIFYYVILRTGIKYFYRVRDPDLKTIYAANLVSVFSLMIAQFSQLAIGQYPNVLYFYSALAIFLKLHLFDSSKTEENN